MKDSMFRGHPRRIRIIERDAILSNHELELCLNASFSMTKHLHLTELCFGDAMSHS